MKLPAGHRLIHFERIDSTNAEARRLAEGGERGPLWIWSDEQTGGRGRLGRTWVSEPGNLYVTCLFQTAAAVAAVAQVSFVAAIAVHELASNLLPKTSFFLKWPNDVLMDGAKFCGILAEVVAQIQPGLLWVVASTWPMRQKERHIRLPRWGANIAPELNSAKACAKLLELAGNMG